ncbi:ribonuclease H-like domain-containing protein [Tanacetum coccineum]
METSPVLRKSSRKRNFPSKLNDFVVGSNVKYGLEKYNPKWIDAMNLEMEALHENNTYELSDLPPWRKAIGCKRIWKIMYKSSGEVDRYKASLVIKGYSQREGIDYEETFSYVVKIVIAPSQHIHAPLQSHFTAALRVLRYLKNAPRTGVHLHKGKSDNLCAYSDAD